MKEGPRTWNNEKRYRMFMIDALNEIITKLDKLIDIKEDGTFKENMNEGNDSVLGQVLTTIKNTDTIEFRDISGQGIENDERKRKN